MRNKIVVFFVVGLMFACIFYFTVYPDKHRKYLGIYECIYIIGDGILFLSHYEYYTLELKENGNLTSKFKLNVPPYSFSETKSKFYIDGEKFIEKIGSASNEYKYIDGLIILELKTSGMNVVAKFKRVP